MLQLANDASYFTSQKLTLLAHGIAARQSQIVFSARKFDGEIKAEQKIVPKAVFKISRLIQNFGRSGGIRTHDPYTPSVVRYQTALRSVHSFFIALRTAPSNQLFEQRNVNAVV